MRKQLEDTKKELDSFYSLKNKDGVEEKEKALATDYLNWVQKKTRIIANEKSFVIPDHITIKRGDVFWIEFGYNIDEEFGGRHPGIILRRGGNTVFVVPLSTQEPNEQQKSNGNYVEIPRVYDFKNIKRWVNVLNATPISIQRIDFTSNKGNVKGFVLDKINEAMDKTGLWRIKKNSGSMKKSKESVK